MAVGTRAEHDGATRVRLLPIGAAPTTNSTLVYEGRLDLPSHQFTVSSVFNDILLSREVKTDDIGVQVWVNDLDEPDEIAVVLDA